MSDHYRQILLHMFTGEYDGLNTFLPDHASGHIHAIVRNFTLMFACKSTLNTLACRVTKPVRIVETELIGNYQRFIFTRPRLLNHHQLDEKKERNCHALITIKGMNNLLLLHLS